MLSDPLTIGSGFIAAGSVPAVSREANKSVYRKTVGNRTFTFTVSHQDTKTRTRSLARLDVTDISNDPLVSSQNRPRTVSAYFVLDWEQGFTAPSDAEDYIKELVGFLGICTSANYVETTVNKIVGGES